MAAGTGKRRLVLLFLVLAGLFLMHGLNSPSMHGMPMPLSSHAHSAMPAATPMPESASMPEDATIADAGTDAMTGHAHAEMTCVPLRPEGMEGLFLALLLIVITPWRPRLSLPTRLLTSRWPNGPPRTGVQVLRTLSISRT